jgi:4'-phosphopantetheinyl transferase
MFHLMLHLKDSEVHIWKAHLDPAEDLFELCARLISDTERARAAAFCFDNDRRRWIMARGILRDLLGRYLKVPPQFVRIESQKNGKPYVIASPGLEFNLSHSAEIAVYAFCLKAVGIDVEKKRLIPEAVELASRYFSSEEQLLVKESDPAERSAAFLRCWSRKEALLKASGSGLSHLLTRFSPSESAPAWTIANVDVGEGYVAAVAMHPAFAYSKVRNWNSISGSPP